MKCFEVDFNRTFHNLFTVIDTDEQDLDYFSKEDLPVEGETVFVYSLENITFKSDRMPRYYDAGFGFVTKVRRVWQNERTVRNGYIVEFENPDKVKL